MTAQPGWLAAADHAAAARSCRASVRRRSRSQSGDRNCCPWTNRPDRLPHGNVRRRVSERDLNPYVSEDRLHPRAHGC